LRGDIDVDVAIVGGGFTGLSSAYHIKKAEPNLKVALLESEVIGFGASGRNGGFNMTLFGLTLSIMALRFGKQKAREAHHYMERAVDYLRDLVAELGIDCDYEHPGFLRVATSEKYKKRILHEIELAGKLGLEGIEWLDEAQTREQVQSPMYLGAWWEPRCGILNPAKLSWGWADVIRPMGVEVYENSPVAEIARNLVHYYRLTADNRLVMGGRDVSLGYGEDMEKDLNPVTFEGLKDDVREIFPTLKEIQFTHEWGGPVSVPLDMAPAIGFAGDKNVVYSLGTVGHGVSMTQLNGRTIADLILERKTDLTDVFFVNRRTIPWPPEPLRNLAIKAIRGYMQWEDRMYDPKPQN
jgi:glycine/D-amino acid oxidase-like deaminating enzyme